MMAPATRRPASVSRLTKTRLPWWRVARVLVTGEMVEVLVEQGDVDEANSSDPDHVGEAITAAARRGLDLA